MDFENHPAVRRFATKANEGAQRHAPTVMDGVSLRHLASDCGAHDIGVVEIGRRELDSQRVEILRNYAWTKSLVSFVVRMARAPVRGAPRSVVNLEFHRAGEETNHIGAAVVAELEKRGTRTVNPSMAFPMEMYQASASAMWVVS